MSRLEGCTCEYEGDIEGRIASPTCPVHGSLADTSTEDMICTCGHKRLVHTAGPASEGWCADPDCTCGRFTPRHPDRAEPAGRNFATERQQKVGRQLREAADAADAFAASAAGPLAAAPHRAMARTARAMAASAIEQAESEDLLTEPKVPVPRRAVVAFCERHGPVRASTVFVGVVKCPICWGACTTQEMREMPLPTRGPGF